MEKNERGRVLRIAVASSDGKVVNQHFGHAGRFLIFEVEAGSFRFLELREGVPVCRMGNHDEEALRRAADALSDCSFVIAGKIGPGAARVLLTRRIRAFVDADFIDRSLAKLLASGKLRFVTGKWRDPGVPAQPARVSPENIIRHTDIPVKTK